MGAGEKIDDFTGNRDDGTITGNVEWVDGKFGKALKSMADYTAFEGPALIKPKGRR